jgi:hypothetical protein
VHRLAGDKPPKIILTEDDEGWFRGLQFGSPVEGPVYAGCRYAAVSRQTVYFFGPIRCDGCVLKLRAKAPCASAERLNCGQCLPSMFRL